MFQFTPLRKGRPPVDIRYELVYEFQFTPLRKGRPPRFGLSWMR